MDTNKHGMVGKVNKTLHTNQPARSHHHTKTARTRPRQADLLRVHISVSKQAPNLVFIHNYQWETYCTTYCIKELKIKTSRRNPLYSTLHSDHETGRLKTCFPTCNCGHMFKIWHFLVVKQMVLQ